MKGKLVLLAGGISSRMKKPAHLNLEQKLLEDADFKAKSMIGVGDNYRPFLDYLLWNAREANYNDIVIVIGENDFSIKQYYGNSDSETNYKGLNISYAVQPIPPGRVKPWGTADALYWGLKSKPGWKGSKFTVCNSDNLYSIEALIKMLNSPYPGALIDYDRSFLEFDTDRIAKFAVTLKNEKGFLKDIIEKPANQVIDQLKEKNGYVGVSMNIFSLDYSLIIPILETVAPHPERQEKELPEAVRILANKIPDSVYAYPFKEHVPDLTSKDDILQVSNYLKRHYQNFSF